MEQTEIINFINQVELFNGLTEKETEQVAEKLTWLSFSPKQHIFEEKNERLSLYLIFDGEVEVFKTDAFGREKRLTIFGKYDFMGESSLIEASYHSTSARTLSHSSLLHLDSEEFKTKYEEHSAIKLKIIKNIAKVMSRRMSFANDHVVNVATQYTSGKTRKEHDLLGDREVPDPFYYGVQTLRAIENFNITGVTLSFYPDLVEGLAVVKKSAAMANYDLKLLDEKIANAIMGACDEILNGKYHKYFAVDMIQGGAGTSTNMNANEVIANKALEILGYNKGEYEHCHPNNHVNLSQSTNDAYPTAVKIALLKSNKKLVKVLLDLISSFRDKAEEFSEVIKLGRTQLQDAVPMTLGQSFEAYATTLEEEVDRLTQNANLFLEVNMGATAIGTGINADPRYRRKVIGYLREYTGMDLVSARNLVEATQDTSAFIMYSSAIKRTATKLSKISNDLRLLSSGPRAGFNEINLPPMQPGSSIMPGKVNPVIPEVVNQIAYKVIGNDLSVNIAAESGQLELNVMQPVIVQSLFESIEMLKNGMTTFMYRCIDGITANKERCRSMVMDSIGLVTALNPVLGYEKASEVAKEALHTNKRVYDLILEKKLLSKEKLDQLMTPENMIRPQKKG